MRVETTGAGRKRVVLLHGFTQQAGHMREAAQFIGHPSVSPDLPGHGPDPHFPATMDEAVERVVDLCSGAEALVGYSMGGRVALRAAGHLPHLFVLVLISTTAGLPEADRQARVASDEALARRFETDPFDGMVDEWLAQPLFRGMNNRSGRWREHDRELRLAGTGAGLAAALRGLGQGGVERVSDEALAALPMRVECVAGAADPVYAKEAERMASIIPGGVARIHPTAGHTVLAEDPGFGVRDVRVRLL